MRTLGAVCVAVCGWFAVMVIFGMQAAAGGFWMLVPLPQLIMFFFLFRSGLGMGMLAAGVTGLAFDLTMPFPFGAALLAFPSALLVVFLLFQTIFSQDTGASRVIATTAGIALADFLTWLYMHILYFFTSNSETLAMSGSTATLIGLRVVVGAGVLIIFTLLLNGLLRPVFGRFFIAPHHGTRF